MSWELFRDHGEEDEDGLIDEDDEFLFQALVEWVGRVVEVVGNQDL
jgi:hypothetical protein